MATTRSSKTGAAKAPARRAARPARPAAPAVDRVDILDEFGTADEPPVPITLLGVDAEVRRSYTGAEAVAMYRLAADTQFEDLLTLLTSDGPGLWAKIGTLIPEHAAKALNRIIKISGLHEGELLAPLPWSALPNPAAGALPTPESDATTD